ncbi:MAG: hypothetical protein ACYC4H_01720 [Desulfocucumaceae bacterium]
MQTIFRRPPGDSWQLLALGAERKIQGRRGFRAVNNHTLAQSYLIKATKLLRVLDGMKKPRLQPGFLSAHFT